VVNRRILMLWDPGGLPIVDKIKQSGDPRMSLGRRHSC
jgi:hypothetical protein